MSYKGIRAPTHGKISNPTRDGEKVKRLKRHHAKTLNDMGVKTPKSPI